jgi:hypothetical protein
MKREDKAAGIKSQSRSEGTFRKGRRAGAGRRQAAPARLLPWKKRDLNVIGLLGVLLAARNRGLPQSVSGAFQELEQKTTF